MVLPTSPLATLHMTGTEWRESNQLHQWSAVSVQDRGHRGWLVTDTLARGVGNIPEITWNLRGGK